MLLADACPSFAGFTFNSAQDIVGFDLAPCNELGDRPLADVATECKGTQGCNSFNVWGADGGPVMYCLKGATADLGLQYNTGWSTALRCRGTYIKGGGCASRQRENAGVSVCMPQVEPSLQT